MIPRKNFFPAGSTGSFGLGFLVRSDLPPSFAQLLAIPHESFHMLTSLVEASLSSYVVSSSA
jgi:hypothetical protein